MAYRLYGYAAMTAAGFTVLFMAGTAQAQEYEIRGCRPNVEMSVCCPNMSDFPLGSALISNGRSCRLDVARNRDVSTTGSLPARGAPGLNADPAVSGTNGSVSVGGRPGSPGGSQTGGQTGSNGGHGGGKDKSKDNAGLGNGMEGNDFSQPNPSGAADPDNPGHGGSRDFGGGSHGGEKGGKEKG